MQIRQLEYFVAVAELLNFTKAAKQFYISQTAVMLQIKALEEKLGVVLFYRTNRKVELTPAGKTFLEDAQAILRRTRDVIGRAQKGEEKQLPIIVAWSKKNNNPARIHFFRTV